MRVLITGCAGQDGVLTSRKLASTGYEVIGLVRPGKKDYLSNASPNTIALEIDLRNQDSLEDLLNQVKPTHIVNLAGFSSVSKSWTNQDESRLINVEVVKTLTKWILKSETNTRLVHASSSEIFGGSQISPQNERSELNPLTPYGFAKAEAHLHLTQLVLSEGLNASIAILYNHESPLRSKEFVTKHIASQVASLALGRIHKISIGNTSAHRDWGWAPDYVNAMISILNQPDTENFVLATGISNTVESFIEACFNGLNMEYSSDYLEIKEDQLRKIDPANLVGNSTKARQAGILNITHSMEEVANKMVLWEVNSLKFQSNLVWKE